MESIQFLFISDLHLACHRHLRPRPVFRPKILRQVAEHAYAWREDLDGVLISGDLADSGVNGDLLLVDDFLNSPPGDSSTPWLNNTAIQTTLASTGLHVGIVPGNHDRFHQPIQAQPGSRAIDDHPRIPWNGYVSSWLLPDDDHPRLAVVRADFSLARTKDTTTPGGRWGQGRVHGGRLKELVKKTRRIRNKFEEPPPVLWMIHFAPRFYASPSSTDLLHADLLAKAAARENVKHLLCGHEHRYQWRYVPKLAPDVRVFQAGTACCRKDGWDTMMHVIKLEVDGGQICNIRRMNWRWNEESGRFEAGLPKSH